jgi:hypothetical protein
MNAIYLLGCHYAPGGSLAHLEPMFLSKARASLAESLEHADRLKDFLFASALLACYFYFKGRLLEGQHHNSAGEIKSIISNNCALTQKYDIQL